MKINHEYSYKAKIEQEIVEMEDNIVGLKNSLSAAEGKLQQLYNIRDSL